MNDWRWQLIFQLTVFFWCGTSRRVWPPNFADHESERKQNFVHKNGAALAAANLSALFASVRWWWIGSIFFRSPCFNFLLIVFAFVLTSLLNLVRLGRGKRLLRSVSVQDSGSWRLSTIHTQKSNHVVYGWSLAGRIAMHTFSMI